MVTAQLSTRHTADGMDEIAAVQIFKPVLVQVVGIGMTVEIVGRRIFSTLLVTSVLRIISVHVER